MRYLHTMVRVANLDAALHFYRDLLGMKEVERSEHEQGRFTAFRVDDIYWKSMPNTGSW